MKKSYNKDALRGSVEKDDATWAQDVLDTTGIAIPQNLLYTADGPRYLMRKIRDMNLAQMEEENIPKKKAEQAANNLYKTAKDSYESLLQFNKRNDTQ